MAKAMGKGMVRYIWCPRCYRKLIVNKELKETGLIVIMQGLAAGDFVCDYCAAILAVGYSCYAISMVDSLSDHESWEKEYLTQLEKVR